MSAHKEVSRWLEALAAEAVSTQATLACMAPGRFWRVAEGLDVWRAEEERHLRSCPRCRNCARRVAAVASARTPAHARLRQRCGKDAG